MGEIVQIRSWYERQKSPVSDRSIIYTAIAGGYDRLQSPRDLDSPASEGIRRMAFVDNPALCGAADCPGWQIKIMTSICTVPLMQAKRYKVLSHEALPADTAFSLWVDGSVEFNSRLDPAYLAMKFLGNHDLALFRHSRRGCIYREAHACQIRGLDDPSVMARQMNQYRAEGYPRNNGLAECTMILRRHTPMVERLNNLWWSEIQ